MKIPSEIIEIVNKNYPKGKKIGKCEVVNVQFVNRIGNIYNFSIAYQRNGRIYTMPYEVDWN